MAIGKNAQLQLGIESEYGTSTTATQLIKHTSEGFKLNIDSKSEETLIGGKVLTGFDIMGMSIEGDLSAYARPETIGYLLSLGMGFEGTPSLVEGSTIAYKHSFNLIGSNNDDVLPSATFTVDRKEAVKAYTGCKCDSTSIDISQGDYIKVSQTYKGKAEETGTLQSLSTPSKKAFKFVNGTCKIDGSNVAFITGGKIDISNSLDDGGQSLGSGLYNTEYDHQGREVSISLDVNYVADVETLRENKFKTGDTIQVELTFTSNEEVESGFPYSMVISLPLVNISDLNPTVDSIEKITTTIEGIASEDDSNEPITIDIVDDKETKYIV